MKTVVFFSSYYLPHLGGIEKYIYNLAKQLHQKGHRVIIVTCQYSNDLKLEEQTDIALIYRLPISKICAGRYPIFRQNKEVKKVFQKLLQEKIDLALIQTRFWLLSYYAAKFTHRNHIPALIIEHGSDHLTVQNKVLDKIGELYEHVLTRFVKKHISHYYGASRGCNKWLKHFGIKATGVLYNSINKGELKKYQKYIKKPKTKITITFAGRMLDDKGVLELIQAFKQLSKKYKNLELNLAGSGPLDKRIAYMTNGIKNIHILGQIDHDRILKLLGRTSIFVNPSRSEGMPTAILEAGMMQCAVIATPVGGTTEIIPNIKYGIFCKKTPSSIKNKLEQLIKEPCKIPKLGKNLQQHTLKKFTWEEVARKVINLT